MSINLFSRNNRTVARIIVNSDDERFDYTSDLKSVCFVLGSQCWECRCVRFIDAGSKFVVDVDMSLTKLHRLQQAIAAA